MFYDTKVQIIDGSFQRKGLVYVDMQPFDNSIIFEDGIEILISKRVFCDIRPEINMDSYILCNDKLYKVMKIKTWSDYMECWLYECERGIS